MTDIIEQLRNYASDCDGMHYNMHLIGRSLTTEAADYVELMNDKLESFNSITSTESLTELITSYITDERILPGDSASKLAQGLAGYLSQRINERMQ